MRRRWFQAADGTYYRNFNIIEQDLKNFWNWNLPWRRKALMDEVRVTFNDIVTADTIGRRDTVVKPLPFRKAHPADPRMWVFDQD